jgi:hypothetical protein
LKVLNIINDKDNKELFEEKDTEIDAKFEDVEKDFKANKAKL